MHRRIRAVEASAIVGRAGKAVFALAQLRLFGPAGIKALIRRGKMLSNRHETSEVFGS
jgi:hypothetical protein